VELRHLRSFVVLAEELHFGRAAVRLHLAQPALTKQMQTLERLLAVRLLDRSSRRVALTDAGRAFLSEARLTLEHADRSVEVARRSARGEIGLLRVGFSPSAPNGVFPHIIRTFEAVAPGVALELVEAWSGEQGEAVVNGRLDFGFAQQGATTNPLLASEVLQEDPLIAVVPEGHRLGNRSAIALGDLASDRFVSFPRSLAPAYFDELIGLCRAHGFSPNIVQEAKGVDATLGLVAAGLGVALLPGSVVSLRRDHVRFVMLAGESTVIRTYIVWRRDDDRPVVRRFLEVATGARVQAAAAEPALAVGDSA